MPNLKSGLLRKRVTLLTLSDEALSLFFNDVLSSVFCEGKRFSSLILSDDALAASCFKKYVL